MRRVLSIFLLLAVIGGTAWTLMRWNRGTTLTADPWKPIPGRAAIILEVPDALVTWDRFTHTSQFWSGLERIPAMRAIGRSIAQAMERAENDAAFRGSVDGTTILVAVMRTGGEQADALLTYAPRSMDGAPVRTFTELLHIDEAAIGTLLGGNTVQCRPDPALPALSVAVRDGVWIIATSTALMDEALLQEKNPRAIDSDTLLREASRTLGAGADAHLLVHLERARDLLHTWCLAPWVDALDVPGGWAALDLRARPDAFLLSGLVLPAGAHPAFISLEHQGTGRNDLGRWLPAEVAAWDVRQVDDAERLLTDIGIASDSTATTLGPQLFHWVHGSMAIARDSSATDARTWALFQTGDPEGAANELRRTCPDGIHCDTLTHRGVRMTLLPVANAYERLLGPAYAAFQHPWWCVLNDVVVFAPTTETLRTAIDAWYDGLTLAEDARTNAWTQRIASTAGRTMRWDVARYAPRLADGLKDRSDALKDTLLRSNCGGASVQLSPAQHSRIHVAIGLEHAPVAQRHTAVHWTTPLPTPATRRPDIVRNHTNGTREVLVQDATHRIHLLGSAGRPQWSYQLDGPILGEVHQVDRFRNGKLQLLFNTADRIYLIDRTGKDVGGYPVKLPARATAPIAVFDYDGTKDHRIIVPVADGRVLNYGLDGAPTNGWEAPRINTPSSNTVRHLRISNKDYILVVNGNGDIDILDRRGGVRERTDLSLGGSARLMHVAPGIELMSTRLLWSDSTGVVREAALNGRPRALTTTGHHFLGRLSDDGAYGIIRIAGDSLTVLHGSERHTLRTFGTPLSPEVHRYDFSSGVRYGVIEPERELVTMVDEGGQEPAGLPLRGATAFSIADLDLDGILELVTITADGHVVAYHLP